MDDNDGGVNDDDNDDSDVDDDNDGAGVDSCMGVTGVLFAADDDGNSVIVVCNDDDGGFVLRLYDAYPHANTHVNMMNGKCDCFAMKHTYTVMMSMMSVSAGLSQLHTCFQ